MNVVVGKNEAGKSTLHAALFAALCGVRRARGPARREDQEFAAHHRPWNDGKSWEVGAIVALDDGRRVGLKQILDGSADSKVTDQSGQDLSKGIMNEGNPDASLWVGLDRRSFRATACVRQAEVLEVLDDAEFLQTHLQRVAAGASKDETAARALSRIAEFEREHVGPDKLHSPKPLRRAKDRLAAATLARDKARQDRVALAEKWKAARDADAVVESLSSELAGLEASVARSEADELGRRVRRARELADRFPGGAPVPLPQQDDLVTQVVAATQSWKNRPGSPSLTGPDSEELRRAIAGLPEMPVGDLEPDGSVTTAEGAHERAKLALELHMANRPAADDFATPLDISEQEIRQLAETLDQPAVDVDARLDREIARTENEIRRRGERQRSRRFALLASVTLVLAGLAAVPLGFPWVGVALLGIGIALAAVFLTRSNDPGAQVAETLRTLQADREEQRRAMNDAAFQRQNAKERAVSLGLTDRPMELRRLADTLARRTLIQQEQARWELRESELRQAAREAEADLRTRLRDRGVTAIGGIDEAVESYTDACRERRERAARAATRPGLEERLIYRETAERSAVAATETAANAERLLRAAAKACGLPDADGDVLHAGLLRWLESRKGTMATAETAQREWTELQTLLDGRSLAEITRESGARDDLAMRLAADFDDAPIGKPPPDASTRISRLRGNRDEASRRAAALQADAQAMERSFPSTTEVETEVAAADAGLREVEQLGRTLTLTREFLERAQDRVHLTIAPLLQATLDRWLPRVTNGRYVESLIDPETLKVRLRSADGHLRDAQLLSHGTAEQAYLLLRMAMTDHLTNGHESCPLILDDVVVQSDVDRMRTLLDLLHEISSTRQVILFTVSAEAAAWAADRLHEPTDHLERLDDAVVSP